MKLLWNAAPRTTIPFLPLEPDSSFLEAVRLPLQGWFELERDSRSITWGNASDQVRRLELVDGNGGFPAINQTSLDNYRRVMRQNALERGHGIVEVQLSMIAGVAALKTITKHHLEHRLGFGYDGWICVPLPKLTVNIYSKVLGRDMTRQRTTAADALLRIQRVDTNLQRFPGSTPSPRSGGACPLHLRHAAVYARTTRQAYGDKAATTLGNAVDPSIWIRDPYDPEFDEVALHHLTDEARFDHIFPNHPLTLVRQDLRTLEHHTVFRLQKQSQLEPFERKP